MKFFEWQEISERDFKGTTGCGLFQSSNIQIFGQVRYLLLLFFKREIMLTFLQFHLIK